MNITIISQLQDDEVIALRKVGDDYTFTAVKKSEITWGYKFAAFFGCGPFRLSVITKLVAEALDNQSVDQETAQKAVGLLNRRIEHYNTSGLRAICYCLRLDAISFKVPQLAPVKTAQERFNELVPELKRYADDPSRKGTFHELAALVQQNELEETIKAAEFGARKFNLLHLASFLAEHDVVRALMRNEALRKLLTKDLLNVLVNRFSAGFTVTVETLTLLLSELPKQELYPLLQESDKALLHNVLQLAWRAKTSFHAVLEAVLPLEDGALVDEFLTHENAEGNTPLAASLLLQGQEWFLDALAQHLDEGRLNEHLERQIHVGENSYTIREYHGSRVEQTVVVN